MVKHCSLIIHFITSPFYRLLHILSLSLKKLQSTHMKLINCQYNSICNAYHMYYAIQLGHLYVLTLLCMPRITQHYRKQLHVQDLVPLMNNCTTITPSKLNSNCIISEHIYILYGFIHQRLYCMFVLHRLYSAILVQFFIHICT